MGIGHGVDSLIVVLLLISMVFTCVAYRPGDIVPMSKMGQYHSSRTVWHDMIGKHCPIFGVNREVLIPIPKPTGFTGADPYKIGISWTMPRSIKEALAWWNKDGNQSGLWTRLGTLRDAFGGLYGWKGTSDVLKTRVTLCKISR